MKAYAIVMRNHDVSEKAFKRLVASSEKVGNEFKINRFDAVLADQADALMERMNLKWTWPWKGSEICPHTKIRKVAYGTQNPKRRIACFLSHYLLWNDCSNENEPFLILEHDAEFIKRLDWRYIVDSEYEVIGLNDPRGATRLSQKFHSIVQNSNRNLLPVPEIDRWEIAQGIAGNSAYIIKPIAANEIINKVKEIGAWPNDATICQQLFPWIGVTKTYYTKVQNTRSTTSTNA